MPAALRPPQLSAPLEPNPAYRFRAVAAGAALPQALLAGFGDRATAAAAIVAALQDAARSAAELRLATGLDDTGLWTTLDRLHDAAAVTIVTELPLPAGPLWRHLLAHARQIAAALELPALRRRITGDAQDPVLRLGAYVEEFHYIAAVSSYLGPALGAAATARQRAVLAAYLAAEHEHGDWVAGGLAAAGIERAALALAQPLPSTLALLNFLRWVAASDLPAFCVCLGATEGTAASLPEIDAEFASLRAGGRLPEAVWAPFEQHARSDAEQSHGEVFAEVFIDAGWIAPAAVTAIRNALWQYWYAYRAYYQGIIAAYAGQPALRLFGFG